eukprot:1094254-Karenia_brevis.AAC.1
MTANQDQSEIDYLDRITDTFLDYGYSTCTVERDYNDSIREWIRSVDECLYSHMRKTLIMELDFDNPEHIDVAHALDSS